MAKSAKIKIRLVSSEKTGTFYVTTKNPRQTPDKFEVRKYDKALRRHVLFKEAKIK